MKEVLLAALRYWLANGLPENSRGWLVAVASRRLTHEVRTDAARRRHESAACQSRPPSPATRDPAEVVARCRIFAGYTRRSLPSRERRFSSPHDLITCDRPPVGEVALTLQFAGDVVDLDVLAGFVSAVRSEFPRIDRQPTVPHMREQFDLPQPQPGFEITLEPPNALPRTWLISRDETRLIQVQGDRISLNWRRPDDAANYPRYTTLRRDLRRYFKTLGRCFEETGRRTPTVDLAEVTYVNDRAARSSIWRGPPRAREDLEPSAATATQGVPAPCRGCPDPDPLAHSRRRDRRRGSSGGAPVSDRGARAKAADRRADLRDDACRPRDPR